MHETNSEFILLKIPSHSVRLLGKIHALSIEVFDQIKPKHHCKFEPPIQKSWIHPDSLTNLLLPVLSYYLLHILGQKVMAHGMQRAVTFLFLN